MIAPRGSNSECHKGPSHVRGWVKLWEATEETLSDTCHSSACRLCEKPSLFTSFLSTALMSARMLCTTTISLPTLQHRYKNSEYKDLKTTLHCRALYVAPCAVCLTLQEVPWNMIYAIISLILQFHVAST